MAISRSKLLPLENEAYGFMGTYTLGGFSKKEADKKYRDIAIEISKNWGLSDPVLLRDLFDSKAGRWIADSAVGMNKTKPSDILKDVFRTKQKFLNQLPYYVKVKKENIQMSLLRTTAEDLVAARTNDVRAIAKSTMAHDKDDLVGDKDREKDDGGASDAIDTALSTGKVHQESRIFGIKNLNKRELEALMSCQEAATLNLEAKDLNDKVFMNKPEQMAFAHYIARKEMKHPMSGMPMIDDIAMMQMTNDVPDFKYLQDMMAQSSVETGLAGDDKYMKALSGAMDTAIKVDAKSPEVLMWRTVTSRLQPVV